MIECTCGHYVDMHRPKGACLHPDCGCDAPIRFIARGPRRYTSPSRQKSESARTSWAKRKGAE